MRTIVGVLIVGLAACGDDGATVTDAMSDSVAVDAPPCTPRSVETNKYGTSGNGVADGVGLCIEGGPDPCATSTAGLAMLCVPSTTDFAIRATQAGWETVLFLFDSANPGPLGTETGDDAFVTTLWADSGATYPPTTSSLLFVDLISPTGRIANATVSISPNVGVVSYGDANQVAHRALTATSSSGTVYVGDLPPGKYDVTVTATPPVTCRNRNIGTIPLPPTPFVGGFASPMAGAAVRVPTVAGAATNVYLYCTP